MANIFDTITPEQAREQLAPVETPEVSREGNIFDNLEAGIQQQTAPQIEPQQQPVREFTVSETINLLRDDNIVENAQRMGFNFIPPQQADAGDTFVEDVTGDVSFPAVNPNVLQFEKGGEIFEIDPTSIESQAIGAIRPTAQGAGALVGGAIATPQSFGTATIPGAVLGGTLAGQAVDTVAEFFSDSGRTPLEQVEQTGKDIAQEATFALGGEIVGRAIKPAVEGIQQALRATPEPRAPRIEPTLEEIGAPTTQRQVQETAESVAQRRIPEVVEQVQPRADVVRAAREEGFNLTPDQVSGNPAFIELAQAAKSTPGSTLAADEIRNITKLGNVLDDLKIKVGGDIDKAAVNQNVAREFTNMVETLETQEDKLYKKLKQSIPVDQKQTPLSVMELVNREARNVGGKQNLRGPIKQVSDELEKNLSQEGAKLPEVTYGFVDSLRKDVASGYKSQGGFKDASTGNLDQIYKALSEDQQAIANSFGDGVGADMKLARKVGAERIGIQKNAIKFGKDLVDKEGNITDGPFVQKLESAISNLAKGNSKNFDDLMSAIPKSQRSAVAISSIDPLLSSSRLQSGKITGTMANAGRALNRNKTAKAKLYKHLPEDAQKRLDNLFTISDGIFTSVERQNASRTARDVLKAMDEQLSPLRKLYNVGVGAGRFVAPTTTAATDAGANAVKSISGAKSSTAQAADDLLSSPKFNNALDDFMDENHFRAQRDIEKLTQYDKWLKTLPEAQRQEVTRVGLFNWMFRAGSGLSLPEETEE